MKTYTVRRVSYGKSKTPIELREYKAEGSWVVGTKKEWKRWAKKFGNRVKFVEKK